MTPEITFEHYGQGPETIMCLHGIGADATSFHHQMQAFPDFCVVAWDMPGYRGSTVQQHPPSFDHLSDRLETFIDQFGGPVHLVGQSIGGMIALHHAVRRSDQLKSLTLVATTPRFGGRDDTFKDAFLKARLSGLDAGQTMADMAAKTAPYLVGPNTTPAEIDHITTALAGVPERTWREILQCLVTFDRADDLGRVACPTLVVAGDHDQNAPVGTMKKMADKIPNAQFRVMENGGHMLHQEQPKLFNNWLAQFLKAPFLKDVRQ